VNESESSEVKAIKLVALNFSLLRQPPLVPNFPSVLQAFILSWRAKRELIRVLCVVAPLLFPKVSNSFLLLLSWD
jgi:hypothetical protein